MSTSPLSEFGKLVKLELKLIRNENAQQRSGMACSYKPNLTNLAINANMSCSQLSRYLHLNENGEPIDCIKLETLMRLLAVLGASKNNAKKMLASCGFSIDGNIPKFKNYRLILNLAREHGKVDEINELLGRYSENGIVEQFSRLT